MTSTENKTGMTLHEADTFRNIVDAYFQDRTDRAGGRVVDKGVTFRDLTAYIDNLIADRDVEIERLKNANAPRRTVVPVEHMHHDNISICSAGPTLYSIYIDRERKTAKLECFPLYLYFESIEEAHDIRDLLNKLLELNPVIKPNVPRFSSAPFTRKEE